jgi:hypothetical protein
MEKGRVGRCGLAHVRVIEREKKKNLKVVLEWDAV